MKKSALDPGNADGARPSISCLDIPQAAHLSLLAHLPACRKETLRSIMYGQTGNINGRYAPRFINTHQIPESVVPPPPPKADTAAHATSTPDPARAARISQTFLQPTSASPVANYPATAKTMSGRDSVLLAAALSSADWHAIRCL